MTTTPPPAPAQSLGDQLLVFLAAHPDTFYSISQLKKALNKGRSGGVDYAARRLAQDRGLLYQQPGKPVMYRITPAGLRHASTLATAPTPSAPAALGSANLATPITRPGGLTYYPRRLGSTSDIDALRRCRTGHIPVLLYGPPGTGKTSLAEAAFPDLITVAGDADTVVGDLVGDYTQTAAGTYTFHHGPLVTAMREGRALLVDDATLIPPTVLAVLYPAMDGRRRITIKAHAGEDVVAADGFYVIAGHNPGVHGAILTDALASRFSLHIQVTTDYQLAVHLGVEVTVVNAARALAARHASGEIGWSPQLRELLAYQRIRATLGQSAADSNLAGQAPAADRDEVTAVLSKLLGRRIDALCLGEQI